MNRYAFILVLLIVSAIPDDGAADVWGGYSPFNEMTGVAVYGDHVYGSSMGGLFRYDPQSGTYRTYNKNDGLVENEILSIEVVGERLLLGFSAEGLWSFDPSTGNSEIIVFPEYHIRTSENPNGIAVLDITAVNDSIIFVGHSSGLDMLNLARGELKTYSRLGNISEGTPVNRVRVIDGRIWACTSLGLAVADLDDPNLEFSQNWTSFNPIMSVRDVVGIQEGDVTVYYAATSAGIRRVDFIGRTLVSTAFPSGSILHFSNQTETIRAVSSEGLLIYDNGWQLESNDYKTGNFVYTDSQDRSWIGTSNNGLFCWFDGRDETVPAVTNMRRATIYGIGITQNGDVWTATSHRNEPGTFFQRLRDGKWFVFGNSLFGNFAHPISVHGGPGNNAWVGTWGRGFFHVVPDESDSIPAANMTRIDPGMQYIRPTQVATYVVTTDIAEDARGNLWVANFMDYPPGHALEPIPSGAVTVLNMNGNQITRAATYSPLDDGIPVAPVVRVCADPDGWVWIGTFDRGLVGLYTGPDPFDKSDAQVRTDIELHSMRITAMAYDRNGDVFVGTQGGLNRIRKVHGNDIVVDDMNHLLLHANTDVQAIEIDYWGNKWIGTSGGLVKIRSDDTFEEFYTSRNSGLYSSKVLSLKYDNARKVLWIGTDKGLNTLNVSGRTGRLLHVYPNPFEIWGNHSIVTFTNLRHGRNVRIYSFNGTLVNELTSGDIDLGGSAQIEWDGRNFDGRHVASGVYFIEGTDVNGMTFRDKLAVIRR